MMRLPEYNIFTLLFVTRKSAIFLMFGMTFYYVKLYNKVEKFIPQPETEYTNMSDIRTGLNPGYNETDGISRVLFFSYIRGGSSIGSQIFDIDNRSLFWYEPLDPFYFSSTGYFGRKCQKVYMDEEETMLRPLKEWELHKMTSYMSDLYGCRMAALPSELLVHRFLMHTSALKPYTSCYEHNSADSIIWDLIYCRRMLQNTCGMSVETALSNQCPDVMDAVHAASNVNKQSPSRTADFRLSESEQGDIIRQRLNHSGYDATRLETMLPDILQYRSCLDDLEELSVQCLPFAQDMCAHKPLRAAKIVRATLQPVATLLETIPSLKVIVFVRDPRAVAFSRSSNAKPKDQVLRNFLKLCMKMRADLYYKQEIERFFPHAVTIVRYEDFVVHPMNWIKHMYRHIGIDPPLEAAEYLIHTHLYAGRDDGLKFGDVRANASKIAYKWLPLVAPDLMFKMQQACPDILTTLGYTFY